MKLPQVLLILVLMASAFSAALLARDLPAPAAKTAKGANKEISRQVPPPHKAANPADKS